MTKHRWVPLWAGLLVLGCGGAPRVDWQVEISGHVQHPQTLTYGELVALPAVELADVAMDTTDKEGSTDTWAGPSMTEILRTAGVPDDYTGITAVSADGYAVQIRGDELADAIVALKRNGRWIARDDEDHGPLRLVCPHAPANRWPYQLVRIEVRSPLRSP